MIPVKTTRGLKWNSSGFLLQPKSAGNFLETGIFLCWKNPGAGFVFTLIILMELEDANSTFCLPWLQMIV
jgi:hypothetical protein